MRIDAADVAGWTPPITLAADVDPRGAALLRFRERAGEAYQAPAIRFEDPRAMLVGGRHFAVIGREGGLVEASVHTLPHFPWRDLFAPIARIAMGPPGPALVAASSGHGNYYHWLFETLAAAVARRALGVAPMALVVPPLGAAWQGDALAAFGIDDPLIELAPDAALVLDQGVLTTLTGPGHSFAPHPALLDLLRQGATAIAPHRPHRRVYLARLDAGDRRRMENEAALCAALAEAGFEIVSAGTLSVVEQIALVRDAALIVAPHGAALANLAFAEDGAAGPIVIELLQENYPNRCFLKLCQAKRLRYRATVHPCTQPGAHHHQSTWRADIALVLATIAAAGQP